MCFMAVVAEKSKTYNFNMYALDTWVGFQQQPRMHTYTRCDTTHHTHTHAYTCTRHTRRIQPREGGATPQFWTPTTPPPPPTNYWPEAPGEGGGS